MTSSKETQTTTEETQILRNEVASLRVGYYIFVILMVILTGFVIKVYCEQVLGDDLSPEQDPFYSTDEKIEEYIEPWFANDIPFKAIQNARLKR